MDAAERTKHREMILNPYKWPMFHLPLKRPQEGGGIAVALLRTATSQPDAEFHVDVNQTIFGVPVAEVDHVVYPDVDALLDDGWIVD